MIFKYQLLIIFLKSMIVIFLLNQIGIIKNELIYMNKLSHFNKNNKLIQKDVEYRTYSLQNNSVFNQRNPNIHHLNQQNDNIFEGRKKKRKNLLQRILPMFLIPFLVQSAILPIILSGLKFLLIKSLVIGKIALILMVLNIIRRNDYSPSEVKYYGYSGNEEYGAYVN